MGLLPRRRGERAYGPTPWKDGRVRRLTSPAYRKLRHEAAPEVLLPQGSVAGAQKSVVALAATTRERMNGNPYLFRSGRTATVNYQEYVISIPPTHAVGQVEAPSQARGDPQTEFVTVSNRPLSDQDFAKALGFQLASQTDRHEKILSAPAIIGDALQR